MQNAYPVSSVKRAPLRLDDLGRARSDEHHQERGRQDGDARVEGRVGEHVLQELLTDEHRPHQGAEHDDPRARGHPEDPPAGDVQVVQGVRRSPLADHERDPGREGDDRETGDEGSLVRHGREVDREDQRADEQRRQDAPEVVDGLGPLVHVSGDETQGEDQRHDRERQRDQEDRPPPEVLEQQAREHRPERRDGAPDPRPQRDRLRPLGAGPERGDQRQGRRERHPRGQPAAEPGDEQHRVARGVRREQRERDRQAPSRGSA